MRQVNAQYVPADCKPGAPMPHELNSVITEDLFYQLRSDCIRAKNPDEFHNILADYNTRHGWNGAVSGRQDSFDASGFIIDQIIHLGGLLGGTHNRGLRTLYFNMPLLYSSMTSLAVPMHSHYSPVMAEVQQVDSAADTANDVPIAYAAPK
jgi:hypothetical protein